MKLYLFSFLAAALVAAPASHGQAPAHPMAKRHHVDSAEHAHMMAQLHLTDAQKAQMKAIHEKYGSDEQAEHAEGNEAKMAGTGNMSGMSSAMTHEMTDMRAVLTPAQQTQFDAMVAKHDKRHDAKDRDKKKHADKNHENGEKKTPPAR